jgi:hypothetical protein
MEYGSLREKIAAEKQERAERYAKFQIMYEMAWKQGASAVATALKPDPMHVTDGRQVWTVDDGPCGFAWVVIKPATSSFARWLSKNKYADKHYHGGLSIWIGDYNQSEYYKSVHAHAMAEYFRANGVEAYSGSRLD